MPQLGNLFITSVRVMCRLIVGALVLVLLTGCSAGNGGDPDATDPNQDATTNPSLGEPNTDDPAPPKLPDPYLEVPKKVILTPPGTVVPLGSSGVIAWTEQVAKAQEPVAVRIVISEANRRSFADLGKWRIPESLKDGHLIFVRLRVTNLSKADLAGKRLPLFGFSDQAQRVLPQTFVERFSLCPNDPLPKKFIRGAVSEICQVFLLDNKGLLAGMAYVPEGEQAILFETKETQKPKPTKGQSEQTSPAESS
jgi:hypothetical protein